MSSWCPLPTTAAAATLVVYIFSLLEVSFVYIPTPRRLRTVSESLVVNQHSTGCRFSTSRAWEKPGSASPFSSVNELKPETILISLEASGQGKNSTALRADKASVPSRCPFKGASMATQGLPKGGVMIWFERLISSHGGGIVVSARGPVGRFSRPGVPHWIKVLGLPIMVNIYEHILFRARYSDVTRATERLDTVSMT